MKCTTRARARKHNVGRTEVPHLMSNQFEERADEFKDLEARYNMLSRGQWKRQLRKAGIVKADIKRREREELATKSLIVTEKQERINKLKAAWAATAKSK